MAYDDDLLEQATIAASLSPRENDHKIDINVDIIPETVKYRTGVSVYNSNPDHTTKLFALLDKFEDVFRDKGFVKLPEEE